MLERRHRDLSLVLERRHKDLSLVLERRHKDLSLVLERRHKDLSRLRHLSPSMRVSSRPVNIIICHLTHN